MSVESRCMLYLTLGLALAAPLVAQPKLDPKSASTYFDAMPVHSDDTVVRELLQRAEKECVVIETLCPPGEQLLRLLFQGSYRDHLPDFVVHLERDESSGRMVAHQPMLLFNRRNTPYLYGVEHLWVLVLADEKVPMTARLTTIRELEANPFSGVMGVFELASGGAEPTVESSAADKPLTWRLLTGEAASERPLYIGSAQLPIEHDIVSRLTLIPERREGLDFQSITGHLSNSRSSGSAFSTALGVTFDVDDTTLIEEGGDPAFNGYVLAKFYLPGKRPRLQVSPAARKRYKSSIGFVVGTNVSNDPFSEIVVGLSFGHVIGKAGLLVGGNSIERIGSSGRDWKPFFGVDFTF